MVAALKTSLWLAGVVSLAATACGKAPDKPASPVGVTSAMQFDEAAWKPLVEKDIPSDSLGASIRRGLYLLRFTPESLPKFATSSLRCTSCHQNDGLKASAAPLTGSQARFPKYMPRSGGVIALADRVNYCFTRSIGGYAIPVGSREMVDILAYLAFISRDVPVGAHTAGTNGLISMKDTLTGNAATGAQLFTAKLCITCHGPEGKGNGPIPALWGATSYAIGASMAREERAASFIWHNMPQTAPGTLTPQEAFDLSAFINLHPRPDSPGKELDWPTGGAPADVPYDTHGHTAHRPPASLFARTNPQGTLVPNPASAAGRGR